MLQGINIDLADVYLNTDMNEDGAIAQALERCKHVSLYLLDRAGALIGLVPTRDGALDDVEEAWADIERTAGAHGISVPSR